MIGGCRASRTCDYSPAGWCSFRWATQKGESVSDVAMSSSARATIALSIHGPAGVLDLVVPAGATAVDVAREYAKQADVPGIPLLQTALGERLNAAVPLGEAGIQPGDVLVATTGVHRPRRVTLLQAAKNAPESPALAAMIAWVAAAGRRARRVVRRSRGRRRRAHRRRRGAARLLDRRRAAASVVTPDSGRPPHRRSPPPRRSRHSTSRASTCSRPSSEPPASRRPSSPASAAPCRSTTTR